MTPNKQVKGTRGVNYGTKGQGDNGRRHSRTKKSATYGTKGQGDNGRQRETTRGPKKSAAHGTKGQGDNGRQHAGAKNRPRTKPNRLTTSPGPFKLRLFGEKELIVPPPPQKHENMFRSSERGIKS